MANTVVFTAPVGQEYTNPDPSWISELIQSRGGEYWASGSGDAGLRFQKEGETQAEMILVIREASGALVHHLYNGEARDYVMSATLFAQGEVTVKHSGNSWTLPSKFFVSREEALDAVQQFLLDGSRTERGRWVEF
jgi:hypothetical protein